MDGQLNAYDQRLLDLFRELFAELDPGVSWVEMN